MADVNKGDKWWVNFPHSPRLVKVIVTDVTHKTREIRRLEGSTESGHNCSNARPGNPERYKIGELAFVERVEEDIKEDPEETLA